LSEQQLGRAPDLVMRVMVGPQDGILIPSAVHFFAPVERPWSASSFAAHSLEQMFSRQGGFETQLPCSTGHAMDATVT
jgi:hypothetical protein